jgi:hypothetical protein
MKKVVTLKCPVPYCGKYVLEALEGDDWKCSCEKFTDCKGRLSIVEDKEGWLSRKWRSPHKTENIGSIPVPSTSNDLVIIDD